MIDVNKIKEKENLIRIAKELKTAIMPYRRDIVVVLCFFVIIQYLLGLCHMAYENLGELSKFEFRMINLFIFAVSFIYICVFFSKIINYFARPVAKKIDQRYLLDSKI